MPVVQLSEAADADLADILAYSIDAFGRDIAPPIHSFPHRSHRIFYDVVENRVIVRRVLHKAMDAPHRLGA